MERNSENYGCAVINVAQSKALIILPLLKVIPKVFFFPSAHQINVEIFKQTFSQHYISGFTFQFQLFCVSTANISGHWLNFLEMCPCPQINMITLFLIHLLFRCTYPFLCKEHNLNAQPQFFKNVDFYICTNPHLKLNRNMWIVTSKYEISYNTISFQ